MRRRSSPRSWPVYWANVTRGVSAGTPAPGFRDIVDGSNGAYSAGPGWDPCSGLGTPDGEARLAKLSARADPARRGELASGVARLLDPAGMGHLFQVLALTSPGRPTPAGFEQLTES